MHRNDPLSDNYHKMTMCEILYNIPENLYDHIETLEFLKELGFNVLPYYSKVNSIDDAIKDYCEEYKRNIEDVNLGTKRHLRQEIASYMITKIKLDYDPIVSKVEEE